MSHPIDPNGVAVKNDAYFSLDGAPESSDILFLSLPWDVTTSYRPGTRSGPLAIIDASSQLDLYTPFLDRAWEMKLATLPYPLEWDQKSEELRKKTGRYISFLETGGTAESSPEMSEILKEANREAGRMYEWSLGESRKWLAAGKSLIGVGGDHAMSLGPIHAYSEKFPNLSVLHFDAHADLRVAYEGFPHSHASIMDRVVELPGVKKLVQVGIRDVSPGEVERIRTSEKSGGKISTYFDWDLQTRKFKGENWDRVCDEIVSKLTSDVFVSFDIDGLDPKLCPTTGTPVPGGLEFMEAAYLIQKVVTAGKRIVGADLLEVAPNPSGDPWDGNVGARMLYQLTIAVARSLR
ncbi:MAG: agmatinase family protein [Cryobacterium sp.]|nr:agmatinase family protein [Oligoflexia bacterium]